MSKSSVHVRTGRGGSARLARTTVALRALLACGVLVPLLVVAVPTEAHASTPQITGGVSDASASDLTRLCAAPTGTSGIGPASASLPADPVVSLVEPTGGMANFTVADGDIYADNGLGTLGVYTLAGVKVSTITLPSTLGAGDQPSVPVVDPAGDIYLSSYSTKVVVKLSPTGAVLWSVDPQGGNPDGLFATGSGASFEVALSVAQNQATSVLLSPTTGAVVGTFPLDLASRTVTDEAGGDLLVTGDGYVTTYSPAGVKLSAFGSSAINGSGAHVGSGAQFYYPGQAVQGSDGTIYTADPLDNIESTSPQGYVEHSTTLGGAPGLTPQGQMFLVGSTLYLSTGGAFNSAADGISTLGLGVLQAYLTAPAAPSDTLGWGASVSTAATANYFAPGTTPSAVATFDPWWTVDAAHLAVSYAVLGMADLTAGTVPTPTVTSFPTTVPLSVPLVVPASDAVPGPYKIQVNLVDTSTSPATVVGTTCMPYTVGAPGDALDFATLPAGISNGGPTDPRGVALNSQLGLDGVRSGSVVNWASLLPNCSTSAPTAATCGASGLTFASASTDPYKAAALATTDGVRYWMQVSGGEPVPTTLVADGWWQQDVAALVSHYATVPVGCGACAPVTGWEPWNEANDTFSGNGGTYATEVLAPFYAAVKSVLPGATSTVIGGSSLNPSTGWWQQLIAAGGLHALDVAAIHPYTGSNDAWDEEGMITQVRQLQALLGSTPLWFTEVGWWSDGDYDYLAQADAVATAMVEMKVLGIPVWNYFYDEGNWGNDGVTFSLVQAGTTDDYVKPAALATMASSGALSGRPYLSMPTTGVPHVQDASFGASPAHATLLQAVWSDGSDTPVTVTAAAPGGGGVPLTITDQYGAPVPVTATSGETYALPVSPAVQYLTYPAGDSLVVGATTPYGTDLALSSGGASASATSSAAGSTPAAVIAGAEFGYGQGWTSGTGDSTPAVTVTLATTATVNRVVVDTQSNGSCADSARDYTVDADEPGTGWVTVATVVGEFADHTRQVDFAPVTASAVRVTVTEVNVGSYAGGALPVFWSPTDPTPAFLHTVEVYAGTAPTSTVDGTALPPLATATDATVPPTITSASSTTFTTGASGSFAITTTGTPPPAITVTGALPTGITLSGAGQLVGTPSQSGTFLITVVAGSAAGTATQAFTLQVDAPPTITSAAHASFAVGRSNSFAVKTSGFPAPSVTVTSGTLPSGVTLGTTGTLSGTPTVDGTSVFTITATNQVGVSASQTFELMDGFTIATTSLPAMTRGQPFGPYALVATGVLQPAANQTVTVTWNAAGVKAPYSGQPRGIAITAGTGVLHGVVAKRATAGTFGVAYRVTERIATTVDGTTTIVTVHTFGVVTMTVD